MAQHRIPPYGQGSFGTWHILPSTSMVDSVTGLRYAECSRAPDYITNIGFLGRWGTYACPQCLPSDIVPIRSWTRTLRPPGIRHRHLPYHTIPYHTIRLLLYGEGVNTKKMARMRFEPLLFYFSEHLEHVSVNSWVKTMNGLEVFIRGATSR